MWITGGIMGGGGAKSKATLGFLTVLDHPQHGLFGGYLVLNPVGRPLEFHCSAPIKPNRAQQILYGPTLEAFLYGEQIGQALVAKAKAQPLLVFTDRRPAMAVREHIASPVALVLPPQSEVCTRGDSTRGDSTSDVSAPGDSTPEASQPAVGRKFYRLDTAHDRGPQLLTFTVGQNRLAVSDRAEDDRRLISRHLAELGESFDLSEPFERIREAIEEAQQAAR